MDIYILERGTICFGSVGMPLRLELGKRTGVVSFTKVTGDSKISSIPTWRFELNRVNIPGLATKPKIFMPWRLEGEPISRPSLPSLSWSRTERNMTFSTMELPLKSIKCHLWLRNGIIFLGDSSGSPGPLHSSSSSSRVSSRFSTD